MVRARVSLLLVAVGWCACQGALLTIDVEQTATTTVEQGTLLEELVGQLGFEDFVSMDVTSAAELENQGVEPGDVRDVRLVEFVLEATAPEGGDLSFLSALELYVEAPDLPRALVAWQDDFPAGQARIEMEIEDVDLTDYAVSRSMTITTEADGHRPAEDTMVEATFVVAVGVTGQGACAAAGGGS